MIWIDATTLKNWAFRRDCEEYLSLVIRKELEKENARLKKLVADISLDNAILKDVAEESL